MNELYSSPGEAPPWIYDGIDDVFGIIPVIDEPESVFRAANGSGAAAGIGWDVIELDANFETGLDLDGDSYASSEDNCPFTSNLQEDIGGFLNSGPDGIGDLCQCGDATGNGSVSGGDDLSIWDDLDRMRRYLVGLEPTDLSELCSVYGAPDCSTTDLVVLYRATFEEDVGLMQRYSCYAANSKTQ
jgi:hypothetical protein